MRKAIWQVFTSTGAPPRGALHTDNPGSKGYNSYTDEGSNHQGLNPAFTYYYVIEATDIYGNTSRSTEIFVQPLADDPYPPLADAGDDKLAVVGLETGFDGTGSRDNDAVASYEWDFGDSSAKAYGAQPTHIYNTVGEYTVTLSVTDRSGNSDSDTLAVTVREPERVGTLRVTVSMKLPAVPSLMPVWRSNILTANPRISRPIAPEWQPLPPSREISRYMLMRQIICRFRQTPRSN